MDAGLFVPLCNIDSRLPEPREDDIDGRAGLEDPFKVPAMDGRDDRDTAEEGGGPMDGRPAVLLLDFWLAFVGFGSEAGAGAFVAALPDEVVETSCLVGDV